MRRAAFTYDPMKCSHTFAYWSVIPPSHCPLCGASLAERVNTVQQYRTVTTNRTPPIVDPANTNLCGNA